jgi:hypothetical protein
LIHTTQPSRQLDEQKDQAMKPPKWILPAIAALVLVLLAVGGIAISNANSDAKARQQQEQLDREHADNVQFYSDNCVSGGRWIC